MFFSEIIEGYAQSVQNNGLPQRHPRYVNPVRGRAAYGKPNERQKETV